MKLKAVMAKTKTFSFTSPAAQHDTNSVLRVRLKDHYSNLAGKNLKMLPKPLNKFTLNTLIEHYKDII